MTFPKGAKFNTKEMVFRSELIKKTKYLIDENWLPAMFLKGFHLDKQIHVHHLKKMKWVKLDKYQEF